MLCRRGGAPARGDKLPLMAMMTVVLVVLAVVVLPAPTASAFSFPQPCPGVGLRPQSPSRCLCGQSTGRTIHPTNSKTTPLVVAFMADAASTTADGSSSGSKTPVETSSSSNKRGGFLGRLKSAIPSAAERQKLLPLGLMFFCILFNYTILRDTKDVLLVRTLIVCIAESPPHHRGQHPTAMVTTAMVDSPESRVCSPPSNHPPCTPVT
jgi:hypothetical protein